MVGDIECHTTIEGANSTKGVRSRTLRGKKIWHGTATEGDYTLYWLGHSKGHQFNGIAKATSKQASDFSSSDTYSRWAYDGSEIETLILPLISYFCVPLTDVCKPDVKEMLNTKIISEANSYA